MVLIFVSKPAVLFTEENTIRRHGLLPGETMFPLSFVSLTAAIISFYLFAMIDLIFD
jgi:hypothetical protein